LHIAIQGKEEPIGITGYNNPNIIVSVQNRSYREIVETTKKHDIVIHVGCHEGCGLGLFEAIACGTPVLTINNPPNNEIIIDGVNGWTVDYSAHNLTDNMYGLTMRSVVKPDALKRKLLEIDRMYNRENMRKSVLAHKVNEGYVDVLADVINA
jgi:glycosyltransferase involved in cell wall biosynthesis